MVVDCKFWRNVNILFFSDVGSPAELSPTTLSPVNHSLGKLLLLPTVFTGLKKVLSGNYFCMYQKIIQMVYISDIRKGGYNVLVLLSIAGVYKTV